MTENHELQEELAEEELAEEELDFHKEIASLIAYESNTDDEKIPTGFTCVTCSLDGSLRSNLHWDKALQRARGLIESGYKVLFDLDLGLFKKLSLPLKSAVQFQALALAVDHFQKEVVEKFHEHMTGVIVLRSNLLFQRELQWDEGLEESYQLWLKEKHREASEASLSLFCRNVVVEYLELLIDHLSPNIVPFVLVDASCVSSPLLFAQLTASDCYKRLQLAISEPLFQQGYTSWQKGSEFLGYIGKNLPTNICEPVEPTTGIVLPAYDVVEPSAYNGLEDRFLELLEKREPFKVISEEYVTTEWSGLDSLHVCLSGISKNGRRKLAGFEAAGGHIIPTLQ